MKVAVTLRAAVMETLHVPVPVQAPPQPTNVEPAEGEAASTTDVPSSKSAEQLAPQLMPDGVEETVPAPLPDLLTVSVRNVGLGVAKFAVTVVAAVMLTVHVPVPEHAPPQPVNSAPPVGDADSVIDWPWLKFAEHVAPQLMPAGVDVTVPAPVPVLFTVRVKLWSVKVAATVVAAVRFTVQVPVPEHPPPLQPVNVEPGDTEAERTTDVPSLKSAEHVVPQLMPVGLDETVPEPVPAFVTVSVRNVGLGIVKFAVTVVAAATFTVHAPVPEHAPPQPVNVDPPAGDAVSVTD